MCKSFGIDISAHQGDFPLDVAVSEGVKFVIIKGGGGDAGLYKDNKFERNYSFAKQLNLPVGSYFYGKALNEDQAKQEAEFYYNNCLKGKDFELPVYYDVEHSAQLNLGRERLTSVIKAFCNHLKQKGYTVGIYSSLSYFNTYFIDNQLSDYEHWVAQWARNLSYAGKCGMWQFGGETNLIRSNRVAGMIVDQDYMLDDYINNKKSSNTKDNTKEKMTVDQAIKKVVSLSLNEVGYHEKASNYMLDDKTANSGSGNYTKYARDLDNISGFYNGAKQGYAYCDVFVDWIFVQAFGADVGRRVIYQPLNSLGAGCTYSMGYYKSNNAFTNVPKIGDQIFFGNSYESTHTGIVVDVSNGQVITVEGNTSDGVYRRTYSINDGKILGYGVPNYSLACELDYDNNIVIDQPINNDNSKIISIRDVQRFLNKNYISLFKTKLDEDNEYGPLTRRALVMSVQKELGKNVTGQFSLSDKKGFPILKIGYVGIIAKLVQCGILCFGLSVGNDGADGDYGSNTANAVKKFQRVKFLEIDGECGPETAYKLFN